MTSLVLLAMLVGGVAYQTFTLRPAETETGAPGEPGELVFSPGI